MAAATGTELRTQALRGDSWAAFLICRRRNITAISTLVLLVAPEGVLSSSGFNACADGLDMHRRCLRDEACVSSTCAV